MHACLKCDGSFQPLQSFIDPVDGSLSIPYNMLSDIFTPLSVEACMVQSSCRSPRQGIHKIRNYYAISGFRDSKGSNMALLSSCDRLQQTTMVSQGNPRLPPGGTCQVKGRTG